MAESIKPYCFEPRKKQTETTDNNLSEIQTHIVTKRAGNTHWCKCEECEVMPSEEESICCHDSNIISNIRGDLECITQHDSFKSVVLNIDTLSTARYYILMHCKNEIHSEELREASNRIWRHVAYRQFVYWMNSWCKLGRKRRKILPSCVIAAVRQEYPNLAGQEYLGFTAAEDTAPEYFD